MLVAQTATTDLNLSGLLAKVNREVSLSAYTSWRVGGCAEYFYRPTDKADFCTLLQQLPADMPLLVLGLGSNVLIRDAGVSGMVVYLSNCLSEMRLLPPQQVYAEAGVSLAQLARFAAKQGLQGGEFLAGIPGTVGGALAMNAGAYGSETWEFIQQVETVDRYGQLHIRQPQDYKIAYRQVDSRFDEWFTAAWWQFEPDPERQGEQRIRQLLQRRAEAQPIGSYNGGSVFRNPPGDYAGRLIEQVGLKGYRIGGAQISDKHANFIVNADHASASDMEQLIEFIQQQVLAATGVQLQPEIRIFGTASTVRQVS